MTLFELIFGIFILLLMVLVGPWLWELRKRTRLSHRDPAIRRSNYYGFKDGRPGEHLRGVKGEKPEKPLSDGDPGSPGMLG